MLFFFASVSIEANLRWCSVQPVVALMKAFWMDGLKYSFSSISVDHLLFKMEVKNFPMHDVSAIGLKFDGDEGHPWQILWQLV